MDNIIRGFDRLSKLVRALTEQGEQHAADRIECFMWGRFLGDGFSPEEAASLMLDGFPVND